MHAAAQRRADLATRFPVWESLTISGALDRAVATYAERPLVITESGQWSYRNMADWSRRIASGMIAIGLAPGDHVALDLANYPEFVALKFAIARAGCVCIPCNFMLRGSELRYVLEQSDAKMLVTMDRFRGHDYLADLVRPAALAHVVAFPTGEGAYSGSANLTLAALEAAATPASDAELLRRESVADPAGLSDIIYTSGTTGRSKGVMLTHDMVMRAAFSSAVTRAFEDGRRIQFALPMYHVFGYVECLIATMFVGGAILPQLVFDAAAMLDLAETAGASEMVCVPMMTHKLIDLARTRGFDSSRFVCMFNSGGTNVPSVWDDIVAVLGARETVTAYGMTETTASTTCTLPEDGRERLLASNGAPKLPSVAGDPALGGRVAVYRVINPVSGEEMPPGNEGELVVRGPIVTKGYYRKPEETAAAFTSDGWLRTGDVGRLSPDGYLSLTGRIKESYRCNGEMVMPREIEELFDDHPHVAQALVVGIPDPRVGEAGCLCIVPRDAVDADPAALLALCREKLARFKVPRHVVVLSPEEIPLTITGRPQKFKLATLAAQRVATKTASAQETTLTGETR
ncbi:class I adenylate-forming enzyme family protein [Novosphingobium lentum]|uniref:class I adenylate-forming enzyme family protein n=1 Tax=Novosphingobium lentum TaxID=145287 RepID=UPI000831AB05|nr:AMP-binding protein [Novosphingobium lentum]